MAFTKRKTGPKTTGAGPTNGDILYAGRTADKLSLSAKIYRDAFVREYIKDFDGRGAVIRLGGTHSTAKTRACQLLREPYVATLLDDTIRKLQPTDIVTRGQVMAKMWDLANTAEESGARVTACANVAKMLGMDRVKEEENQAPIGVMLVPMMSVSDWAASAAVAQA